MKLAALFFNLFILSTLTVHHLNAQATSRTLDHVEVVNIGDTTITPAKDSLTVQSPLFTLADIDEFIQAFKIPPAAEQWLQMRANLRVREWHLRSESKPPNKSAPIIQSPAKKPKK